MFPWNYLRLCRKRHCWSNLCRIRMRNGIGPKVQDFGLLLAGSNCTPVDAALSHWCEDWIWSGIGQFKPLMVEEAPGKYGKYTGRDGRSGKHVFLLILASNGQRVHSSSWDWDWIPKEDYRRVALVIVLQTRVCGTLKGQTKESWLMVSWSIQGSQAFWQH